MLVLAIAGLIFLMVFIALPALQRSQRDTQRKNDAARLKTAIDNYKSNNKGRLPWTENTFVLSNSTDKKFVGSYLNIDGDSFMDPTGKAYVLSFNDISGPYGGEDPLSYDSYEKHVGSRYIFITSNARCEGESVVEAGANRSYAIQTPLESGGIHCLD